MNSAWRILEWLPKSTKWQEWPDRSVILGYYLPQAEPRHIPKGAFVHRSVLDHMEADRGYRPPNLPSHFEVEEGSAMSSGADGRRVMELEAVEEER